MTADIVTAVQIADRLRSSRETMQTLLGERYAVESATWQGHIRRLSEVWGEPNTLAVVHRATRELVSEGYGVPPMLLAAAADLVEEGGR